MGASHEFPRCASTVTRRTAARSKIRTVMFHSPWLRQPMPDYRWRAGTGPEPPRHHYGSRCPAVQMPPPPAEPAPARVVPPLRTDRTHPDGGTP